MYNIEFTSIIFNIFIGLVCLIMGIYGLKQKISISQNIGYTVIGFGIVGFILTLVYVIYNGIVYFNYYNDSTIYKIDEQGAFAEYNEKMKAYECIYYKKDDLDSLVAKYYDLLKSRYNYDYDLENSFNIDPEKKGCNGKITPESCKYSGYIYGNYTYNNISLCTKYYYNQKIYDFNNYDLSARFLTLFLLNIIILLCYFGLIFSGWMLCKRKSQEENNNEYYYFLFFKIKVSRINIQVSEK